MRFIFFKVSSISFSICISFLGILNLPEFLSIVNGSTKESLPSLIKRLKNTLSNNKLFTVSLSAFVILNPPKILFQKRQR